VQTPPISATGTSAIEGQVTGPDGEPLAGVTIMVDEQAAGTTDERGAFTITGLPEGEHALSVQMDGLTFEPQEILVALPTEEAGEITFAARPGPEQAQRTESASVIQPAATALAGANATEITETAEPATEGGVASGATGQGSEQGQALQLGSREIAAIMIAVTCLFLFLVFIILLIRFLAFRRSRKDKEPEAPLQPAQVADSTPAEPTSKSVLQPEMDALLRQGVAEVKAGDAAPGLEKLQQVTQAEPGSAVAWLWSGMAAAKLKDWAQAEACFTRARDLGHPKGDEALKWLQAQKKGKNSK
jgi:hypothetical protein